MDRREFEGRTERFALEIIRFTAALPGNSTNRIMGAQLLKSGTAIGAIYREAALAETKRDFAHKISLSAKEAAETEFWLNLFAGSRLGDARLLEWLRREVNELLRILIASKKTARGLRRSPLELRRPSIGSRR